MEKTVNRVKTQWLFSKDKVLGTAVSKEGHAVFRDIKEPITIDFFEKGSIINSTSNCQLLRQNSPYSLNDPCINVVQNNFKCYVRPIWYIDGTLTGTSTWKTWV